MNIWTSLTPHQWILMLLSIIGMFSAMFCFRNPTNHRLSDRYFSSIFFVYCAYGIFRYIFLIYLHLIHGESVPRDSILILNQLSQVREMFVLLSMLFLIFQGKFGFLKPFIKKGGHYGHTK